MLVVIVCSDHYLVLEGMDAAEIRGSSSVVRASDSQFEGRGCNPRLPLERSNTMIELYGGFIVIRAIPRHKDDPKKLNELRIFIMEQLF